MTVSCVAWVGGVEGVLGAGENTRLLRKLGDMAARHAHELADQHGARGGERGRGEPEREPVGSPSVVASQRKHSDPQIIARPPDRGPAAAPRRQSRIRFSASIPRVAPRKSTTKGASATTRS